MDVWDVLTHDRPAWDTCSTLEYIQANAGLQFDVDVVAAFVRVLRRG